MKDEPRAVIFRLSFGGAIYYNVRKIISIKMSYLLGSDASLTIEKQKKSPKITGEFHLERKEARPYLRGQSLPKFHHVES